MNKISDRSSSIWQERLQGSFYNLIGEITRYKNNYNKALIEEKYTEYIDKIQNTITRINQIQGVNSTFIELQNKYTQAYTEQLQIAKNQMDETIHNTIWDKLVIVFFGQTNAGKSTIIESFRIQFEDRSDNARNDGLIVGDGNPDFTKTYEKYNLSINGKPFILVDTPGIEGKEEDYEDSIKEALAQAHCVFYIQGEGKKPDEATAKRIKKYLNNWVQVYSIYNVRAGARKYSREQNRKSLITEDVKDTERGIKETLRKIVGDKHYKGNINLQALLAMCSVANFSPKRNRLINNQKQALELFGDKQSIFKFSNFISLQRLVIDLSNNFNQEVYIANKDKIIAVATKAQHRIKNETYIRNKELEDFETKLLIFEEFLHNEIRNTQKAIKIKVNANIEHFYKELKRRTSRLHDNKRKLNKEKRKVFLNDVINNFQNNNETSIKKEIENLNKRIEANRKDLNQIRKITFNTEVKIDLSGIDISKSLYKGLESNLLTSGFWIDAGGGALAGSSFGPIGTGIGALLGAGSNLVKKHFGEEDRAKAMDKLEKSINANKKDIDAEINKMLNQINKALNYQKTTITNEIDKEVHSLKEIKAIFPNFNKEITQLINDLN